MGKCCIGISAFILMAMAPPAWPQPSSPWKVVAVREQRPGEEPFEETNRYLCSPADANNVPGPDSLVARVQIDENNHPFVWLDDLRTGKTSRLIDASACLPRWSPDGEYISCDVWTPARRMGKLVVVRMATRSVVLETEFASASNWKWSPDSHAIVAEGVRYERQRVILYTLAVPQGQVAVLDTLEEFTDYEFSWCPDSRWIVFSRPTEVDYNDAIHAADLWIADTKTRRTWPLLETPDWVESNPLWITNHTIQVDRVRRDADESTVAQSVVIELSRPERTQN